MRATTWRLFSVYMRARSLVIPCSLIAILFTQLACSSNPTPKTEKSLNDELAPWYTISGMFPNSETPEFIEELPTDSNRVAAIVAKGGYLVESVAACGQCHANPNTTHPNATHPDVTHPNTADGVLSGGKVIIDDSGSGLAPNITPDPSTGIGNWSLAEVISAIRSNRRPDESPLSEYVHEGYRSMSNPDVRAVAAYLLAQPPIEKPKIKEANKKSERSYGMFSKRIPVSGYVPSTPDIQPTVGYGRYIVHSVAACQRCHSPSGEGSDLREMLRGSRPLNRASILKRVAGIFLKGKDIGLQDETPPELFSKQARKQLDLNEPVAKKVETTTTIIVPPGAPNIRGSEGLSQWDTDDIIKFLTTGSTPTKSTAFSSNCPWESYQGMSNKDLHAVATYLKSF